MSRTSVIHLGETRELLAEWNEVRVAILAGRIAGFHAGFRTIGGETTLYLGGVFRDDSMQAVRDVLRGVAESSTPASIQPPAFRSSRM